MNITRNGTHAARPGPPENFTGAVRIETPFQAIAPGTVMGAVVTFEPGARSAWHTHPLGQTLIVTAGLGLTQFADGAAERIRPGDVVSCPPDRRHWHGATATTSLTHVAINEARDGVAVVWAEHVTDADYAAANAEAHRAG